MQNVQELSGMLRSCCLKLFFLYIPFIRQRVSEKSLFNWTLEGVRVTGTKKKHRAEMWPAWDGVKKQWGRKKCRRAARDDTSSLDKFPELLTPPGSSRSTLYLSNSFCSPLSLHPGVFLCQVIIIIILSFTVSALQSSRVSLNITGLCEPMEGASR